MLFLSVLGYVDNMLTPQPAYKHVHEFSRFWLIGVLTSTVFFPGNAQFVDRL